MQLNAFYDCLCPGVKKNKINCQKWNKTQLDPIQLDVQKNKN